MKPTTILSIIIAAVILSSCGHKTENVGDVRPTGYLGSYAGLKKDPNDPGTWYFLESTANMEQYDSVIIHPVGVWRSSRTPLGEREIGELTEISRYAQQALARELGRHYNIVSTPGPSTMFLHAALTETKQSKVVLDTVSSAVPTTRLLSEGKKLATGTHAFVGKASLEAELVDSTTGQRLGAAVASRAGGKKLSSSKLDSSGAVKDSIDFWAYRLRLRLESWRE